MFSSLTTKLAMRKMGISSDAFNLSIPDMVGSSGGKPSTETATAKTGSNKLRKNRTFAEEDADRDGGGGSSENNNGKAWPAWMSVKALPLAVQPWLTPPPAPIPVAPVCPQPGETAPVDRDQKLVIGRDGRPAIVVFLRCVGCAFAQKTFLNLRTLSNRYAGRVACIAVSHSSSAATKKWLDLLGGAWNVQILIDEDRAIYAAWGLGLGSVWYVLNPNTQIQAWRETGWLGQSVASYMEQRKEAGVRPGANSSGSKSNNLPADGVADGPATIMGNKWQQAGAFAIDERGVVQWGHKAIRADDVLDLDQAVASLGL